MKISTLPKFIIGQSFYLLLFTIYLLPQTVHSQSFTMEQVGKFSFPSELTSSPTGEKIAWAMNEQGKRNIYFAEGPTFDPKKLTDFNEDDGQEISSLQFTPDGNWIIFVRGGDHGGGNASSTVNAQNLPTLPKVQIWKINLAGGKIEIVTEADDPIVGAPNQLAFLKGGQVWTVDLKNSAKPAQLFEVKGNVNYAQYSPDGSKLAFVSNRGSHSLVGIFQDNSTPIQWISPSFHRDVIPQWSPDGKHLSFIRLQGGKGAEYPVLEPRHTPWEIWIANASSGTAKKLWKAPETLRGSYPNPFFSFSADGNLIFQSYEDGWQHLYALEVASGKTTLLTPGDYMVEQVNLSSDKSKLIFSANTGSQPQDLDRRHIGAINLASKKLNWITEGEGIEAYPVWIGNAGKTAFFSANSQRSHLIAVNDGINTKLLQESIIPADFPQASLVVPTQVKFTAPDGTTVYGQLFQKEGGSTSKPGIIFAHGGPQRQMLLGWSYMDYYSNTYALNQYLAELGFVVLSVNFRLGIGYGYEFHRPANGYYQGAVEYQDIKAGGEYLAKLSQVNGDKIGIYGGSYGGYLTALALARDSDLFKVGVDIHGVHDLDGRYELPETYEAAPDLDKAKKIAWESSPMADLATWTSPVLFIHSDDDRNVDVAQTAYIIRRFEELGNPYESIIIPGDTHHWMKWSNMIKVDQATADFLKKHLMD
ncbi:dipeptidyl aminopeptidase/acylaminoacyl peptidase [Algoriphagus ratkowskyi]|uniref:Dipeptidyl aminopeptidase/acylaminoacyl peptidase n=1 Tax=Algoriphagus ratkowskyi TaxID=57028 RepID=A0A2W7RH77_9BACT|nr:prolyl oligopeptidase family serine peptidase [Algoriphagus ratkowskyi]PZX57720.1 dipeptidyl aminopeptidase/acylaminoacyl peptidase [Algoriphagus ratkowskyi]TXD78989.1 prolyl oligopeptidase family serine peptidase [Algoriphagus ratkowskyi]